MSKALLNETHDPELASWIESANAPTADFPIQNLPFGVFRRAGSNEDFRVGVAIGDQVLDVGAAQGTGALAGPGARAAAACDATTLNAFMVMGGDAWAALRLALSRALREGSPLESKLRGCLVAQAQAEHALPAAIGDYTDFYTSIHHATNVGRLLRPDQPLLPNYKWIPIGYHGRASSIGVSGQHVRRPVGQTMPKDAKSPIVGPSKRLDFELELGVFIGSGNALGEPIGIADAERHVFGLCLLNDWSARDIQGWEYQPLGPFLAKSFATTISPWIVTLEALAPYRVPFTRPADDPQPLPYLDAPSVRERGAFDIHVEVLIRTAKMRAASEPPHALARSNYRHAYWTLGQMVAHHSQNGCNLQPGDLLGTGTLSGPKAEEGGSLLELTVGGKQPIALPGGETRSFLEDDDEVVLRAWCESPGRARVGLGEVVGRVLSARGG